MTGIDEKQELMLQSPTPSDLFKCQICSAVFYKKQGFGNHRGKAHKGSESSYIQIGLEEVKKTPWRFVPNYKIPTRKTLQLHATFEVGNHQDLKPIIDRLKDRFNIDDLEISRSNHAKNGMFGFRITANGLTDVHRNNISVACRFVVENRLGIPVWCVHCFAKSEPPPLRLAQHLNPPLCASCRKPWGELGGAELGRAEQDKMKATYKIHKPKLDSLHKRLERIDTSMQTEVMPSDCRESLHRPEPLSPPSQPMETRPISPQGRLTPARMPPDGELDQSTNADAGQPPRILFIGPMSPRTSKKAEDEYMGDNVDEWRL